MSFLSGLASAFLPNLVNIAQRSVGSIAGGLSDIISGENVGKSLAKAGRGILSGINEGVQSVTPQQVMQGLGQGLSNNMEQVMRQTGPQTVPGIIGNGYPMINRDTLQGVYQTPVMINNSLPDIVGSGAEQRQPGRDINAVGPSLGQGPTTAGIKQGGQPISAIMHSNREKGEQRLIVPQPFTRRGGGSTLNPAKLQTATGVEKMINKRISDLEAGIRPQKGKEYSKYIVPKQKQKKKNKRYSREIDIGYARPLYSR